MRQLLSIYSGGINNGSSEILEKAQKYIQSGRYTMQEVRKLLLSAQESLSQVQKVGRDRPVQVQRTRNGFQLYDNV